MPDVPLPENERDPLGLLPMCGRCYDGPVAELFPADCGEHPELSDGNPGMYHCPDCGAMLLAGLPHPELCGPCLKRQHPGIDVPRVGSDPA